MPAWDENNPATFSVMPEDWVAGEQCTVHFAGNNRPWVILWGDSHACQQVPAIKQHCINADHNFVVFTAGLCPPYRPATGATGLSADMNRAALEFIEAKVTARKKVTVILGGYWQFYFTTTDPVRLPRAKAFRNGEVRMFSKLSSLNIRLCVISAIPVIPMTVNPETAPATLPRSQMLLNETVIHNWIKKRAKLVRRNHIADIRPYLCDSTTCTITEGATEMYFDNVHLNVAITDNFNPAFLWCVQ